MNFVKRPVAVFTLSLFVSFCIVSVTRFSYCTVLAVCCAVLFAAALLLSVLFKGKIRIISVYSALILSALAVATIFHEAYFSVNPCEKLYGKEEEAEFTVEDTTFRSNNYSGYIVKVTKLGGKRADFKAAVGTSVSLNTGDIVKATLSFSKPEKTASFDEEEYYLSLGIRVKAECEDTVVTGKSTSLLTNIKHLREYLVGILRNGLGEKESGVASALTLGDKSLIDDSTRKDFSRLGISHLLAISGMHISFISAGFSFIMKKIRIGRKYICLATVFLMLFYMALTGFSPSVVRASLLCILMSVIYIIGISYDGITCLGISGCIMMFADPFCVFSIGLQLSFFSYIGCLIASEVTKRLGLDEKTGDKNFLKRISAKLLISFIFSAFVILFVLPISQLYFDSVSLIAPLVNLFMIPAFSIVLYLTVILLAVSPIVPLFRIVSVICNFIIGFLLSIISKISSFKGITVSLRYPFAPYIIAVLFLSLIALAVVKKKRMMIPVLCASLCIAAYTCGVFVYNTYHRGEITVQRVGGGYSESLIAVSDGESAVIELSDGAPSHASHSLRKAGEIRVTDVDMLILTHYSENTLRCAKTYLSKARIGKILLPTPNFKELIYYNETVEYFGENGIKWEEYSFGDKSADLGNAEITLFRCDEDKTGKTVCLKIENENGVFTYLGKGWSNSGNSVLHELDLSSSDVIFLGSVGSSPEKAYMIPNTDASVCMFCDNYDRIEKYAAAIGEESRFSSYDDVTVTVGK